MFNLNFSCAGDPGIHFEYEYSLRTWYRGYHAGIYDCNFNHHVGDWASTGTRANKQVGSNLNPPLTRIPFAGGGARRGHSAGTNGSRRSRRARLASAPSPSGVLVALA